MHTSQQFKQKLTKMTYVLDNQEITNNQPTDNVQVTTTITQKVGDQEMTDIKPLQRLKV